MILLKSLSDCVTLMLKSLYCSTFSIWPGPHSLLNILPYSLLSSHIGLFDRSWTYWEHSWFRAFILVFPQLSPTLFCTPYWHCLLPHLLRRTLFKFPLLNVAYSEIHSFLCSYMPYTLSLLSLFLLSYLKYYTMYLNIALFIAYNLLIEVKIYGVRSCFDN